MQQYYEEFEQALDILKKYFKNKESQGVVMLNGENVLDAFALIHNTLSTPKNTWVNHNGLERPVLLDGQFGMIEFRDGEKRSCDLYHLPDYMWIHTEEPQTMSHNSIEKRRKWNNEIVRFYIHEI